MLDGSGTTALICTGGSPQREASLLEALRQNNLSHSVLPAKFHVPDKAFLVEGPSRIQAHGLAKAAGADAIIYSANGQRELLHAHGMHDGKSMPESRQPEMSEHEPADNWVKMPSGQYATFRFNPGLVADAIGFKKSVLHLENLHDGQGNQRVDIVAKPSTELEYRKVPEELPMTKAEIRALFLEELAALEKRSKNVREQTRNITHKQAFQRRIAYTQRLGLEPRLNEDRVGFPKPQGNVLEHGRVFPLEHELGHAMMTPEGQTAEDHNTEIDAIHGTDAGAHQENVATQMEFGIDRRAGVGGKGGSLRDYKTKNGREHHGEYTPPPPGGQYVANLHSKVGNSKLSASPGLQAEARSHLDRFDNGTRFDASGMVDTPGSSRLHTKINTGTGGVSSLKALRERAKK